MKTQTEIPVEWLRYQVSSLLSLSETEELLASLKTSAPVSLRVNPDKFSRVLPFPKVSWCANGYYLAHRPSFTHDPLFHTGAYYVQEASSMFIDFIVTRFLESTPANNTRVVLDSCAAPGGKSTLLASRLAGKGVLVSNEVNKKRFPILEENCIKWGTGNIIPVSASTAELSTFTGYFDFILTDAPCSGEGLWRKNPEAVEEWSEKNVENCAIRQKDILTDVWKCLKPGGWLVYSTCTFNKHENEEIVSWLAENLTDIEPVELNVPSEWNIHAGKVNGISCFRFFPGRVKGEGFFAAILRKRKNEEEVEPSSYTTKRFDSLNELAIENLFTSERVWWKNKNNGLLAATQPVFDVLNRVQRLQVSDLIFQVQDEKGAFSPYVCWQTDLITSFFPVHELNETEAISFIRCDTSGLRIDIPDRIPHLATYNGLGLGFIRKIGSSVRIDYPKKWRILKQGKPGSVLS